MEYGEFEPGCDVEVVTDLGEVKIEPSNGQPTRSIRRWIANGKFVHNRRFVSNTLSL